MSILLFFIILAVLVLSHEFGHFIVAKMSGIRVDEFGFGFPPKIFSWKKGETTYSLNLIPFGGFVKIHGEEAPEEGTVAEDADRSFVNKKKSVQAAVVGAGIVFNLLLAWILLSIGFMYGLPTPADESSFGEVTNSRVLITKIHENSPAEEAGLQNGDEIISLTAPKTSRLDTRDTNDVREFIASHGNEPVLLEYKRGSEETEKVTIIPKTGVAGERPAIGISMESLGTVQLPFVRAVAEGAQLTARITIGTVAGLIYFVKDLMTGYAGFDSVTGPVGIIGLVGNASFFGLAYLLALTATISINLAVINCIPFPALDGGRLFFILIETIKGSPIKPKIANGLNTAGFLALLCLMVAITWNDIAKLITG